jgi:hypothetical protein
MRGRAVVIAINHQCYVKCSIFSPSIVLYDKFTKMEKNYGEI